MTSVITRTRPAREVLAQTRELVEPALRAAIDTLPSAMRLVSGYHLGFWNAAGEPAAADGGKALRPALVLLAATAVGGDPSAAVPGAVGVELVHNFSLLHDDVMDGDTTRRHRTTAWQEYGVGPAILAGDALLTLALEALAGSGHPAGPASMRMLSAAVFDLIDGQSVDLALETRTDVAVAECLAMARHKTGALLGCACAMGALLGGGRPAQVERLRAFGDGLGLAFQHVDDLLGIWGDPAATGKPVYSDLRNRKKSLPVVHALTSHTKAARDLAKLYHREKPLTSAELTKAAKLVEEAGGRAWSQDEADRLVVSALGDLWRAGPTTAAAAELTALAHLVTRRDR